MHDHAEADLPSASAEVASPTMATTERTVTEPAHLAVRWFCPSCRGVESQSPANCPKCGLALEASTLSSDESAVNPELRSMLWRLWLAFALALPLVAISFSELVLDDNPLSKWLGKKEFLTLQAGLCTPIVLIAGWPILARAWRSIRTARPNVFTLTGLGIGAAYGFSVLVVLFAWMELPLIPVIPSAKFRPKAVVAQGLEVLVPSVNHNIDPFFDAASVIVVLTLLGQVLELRARARSGTAIRKLVRLTAKTARVVLPDGLVEERSLERLQIGDLIQVRAGERVPVDGMIRDGTSYVDESLLTGEPMRVHKIPGMQVIAGTENGLGVLTIEAQRVKGDTTLAHIVTLVEHAQRSHNPTHRMVDRIVTWFIPIAIVFACATYAGWVIYGPPGSVTTAAVCAIGVLVAACPVALGLATPTAIVSGMTRAAKAGILFRDGVALERLASVDTILFDKTGTLTEGKMKLIGVIPNIGYSADEFLALAAAVERGCQHPIALTIVWEAVRRNLNIPIAEQVESIPGSGVRGMVDGRRVIVGQLGFLQQSGAHHDLMIGEAKTHRDRGHSVVFVGRDKQCIGAIVLNDPLRPSAVAAAKSLKAAKLRLILLTGDHADLSNGLARVVGIDEVIADTKPFDKYAVVQRLKNEGHQVAMCGDGINDAPALAAADVGIAMGTSAEAAITIARVALVHPNLQSIGTARELSRATVRTIRQNLVMAFLYTIVALPLAAGILVPLGGGLISPIWNALGMSVSSLVIVFNSLRLGRKS